MIGEKKRSPARQQRIRKVRSFPGADRRFPLREITVQAVAQVIERTAPCGLPDEQLVLYPAVIEKKLHGFALAAIYYLQPYPFFAIALETGGIFLKTNTVYRVYPNFPWEYVIYAKLFFIKGYPHGDQIVTKHGKKRDDEQHVDQDQRSHTEKNQHRSQQDKYEWDQIKTVVLAEYPYLHLFSD